MTHTMAAVQQRPKSARREAIRVRLVVWGLTEGDRQDAVYKARMMDMGNAKWDITSIDALTDPTNPIPRDEPTAIAQDSWYDYAWAVYPVTA